MAFKRYNPNTPGRRHASVLSEKGGKPTVRRFLASQKRTGGRNAQGKITVRHRGGGAKRRYRIVDFLQQRLDVSGVIKGFVHDPNRSAKLAHVVYANGDQRYVLAQEGMRVGDRITTSSGRADLQPGNRLALEHIPSGVAISNIETRPGSGAVLVRSAGSAAFVMALEGAYATVKMPSGETRMLPKTCCATIGQVSNADARIVRLGKAGRMRHRGVRPSVRGKAMNPVDHPHGGGEGRNPIGMKHPKTPWGKPALGVPTRRRKDSDRFILKRRKENE